jgi:triosephosphate isomerase (TIM)
LQRYTAAIATAKTILWNGPMGMFEDQRFSAGTFAVAQAVADATQKNGAKSIIGGGDSVKALNKSGLCRPGHLRQHRRGSQPRVSRRTRIARCRRFEQPLMPIVTRPRPFTHPLPMNKERKLIIAGNWKMNKTVAEAVDLVNDLKRELANVKEVDIVVCPPFTALSEVSQANPGLEHPTGRPEHERT